MWAGVGAKMYRRENECRENTTPRSRTQQQSVLLVVFHTLVDGIAQARQHPGLLDDHLLARDRLRNHVEVLPTIHGPDEKEKVAICETANPVQRHSTALSSP